jgi:ADP-heptose:LPS heptosyltransferase
MNLLPPRAAASSLRRCCDLLGILLRRLKTLLAGDVLGSSRRWLKSLPWAEVPGAARQKLRPLLRPGALGATGRRVTMLWFALLGRRRHGGVLEAPDWDARRMRILYLRYDRIGGMVLATGIIKAITAARPTLTVDVLASTGNAAVLQGNPRLGTVLAIDWARPWSCFALLARLRRTRYDAVLDATVTAPSFLSMMLMWAIGAPHRIGVGGRGSDLALTLPVPPLAGATHAIDRSAALLAAFGIRTECRGIWRPELYLSAIEWTSGETAWRCVERGTRESSWRAVEQSVASARCGTHALASGDSSLGLPEQLAALGSSGPLRLAVNVSAATRDRCWPERHFIATIIRIRTRFPGASILVLGAPEDRERLARIGGGAGVPVARTAHYRQMMTLIATSDAVLTADSAVTHIASAFSKPAIVLFGCRGGDLYGPYGTNGWAVCAPGSRVDSMGADPVVEALTALVSSLCTTRARQHPPSELPDRPPPDPDLNESSRIFA